jgi:hypothetical protein
MQQLRRGRVLGCERKLLHELRGRSVPTCHGLNGVCELPGRVDLLGIFCDRRVRCRPVLGCWSRYVQRLRRRSVFGRKCRSVR